jgi:hypothetical protein
LYRALSAELAGSSVVGPFDWRGVIATGPHVLCALLPVPARVLAQGVPTAAEFLRASLPAHACLSLHLLGTDVTLAAARLRTLLGDLEACASKREHTSWRVSLEPAYLPSTLVLRLGSDALHNHGPRGLELRIPLQVEHTNVYA